MKDSSSVKFLCVSAAKAAVAVAAVVFSLWLLHEDVETGRGVAENGYVETAQVVFCGLSAAFLLLAWRRPCGFGRVLLLLGLLHATMFVREQDDILDKLLFHGAWQIFALPLGAVFVYQAARHFREIVDGAAALLRSPSGRHLEIGYITLLVYSRVLGTKVIWTHLIPQDEFMSRAAKNAAEEDVELFAYTLLLLAAAELFLDSRKPGPDGVVTRRRA